MSDPYRIDDPGPAAAPAGPAKRGSAANVLLWTLAAVFAGLNTAMSVAGQTLIGSVFGGVALLFVIVAVVRIVAGRRA